MTQHQPVLTPYQLEMIETDLADFLAVERFEIAEDLGIPIDRDWTEAEAARIIAECDERHRADLIRDLLSDVDA